MFEIIKIWSAIILGVTLLFLFLCTIIALFSLFLKGLAKLLSWLARKLREKMRLNSTKSNSPN